MTKTYYQRLNVPENATQSQIQDAWRSVVKEVHPDKNDDPDANQQFIRLKEAHDVLSNPQKRDRYDELGHEEYVSGRNQEASRETEQAYQRDRSAKHGSSVDEQHSGTNWRAYTREHEASEAVWDPTKAPTEDPVSSPDTADVEIGKRLFAYGLCIVVPAVVSLYALSTILGGIPKYGIPPNSALGSVIAILGLVLTTLLVVVVSEVVLDTQRRTWRTIREFTTSRGTGR